MADQQIPETVSRELRRLRALERALRAWTAGEIPRLADSVSLMVDGEEFNFHRSVLGRNPNEVSGTIGDLTRSAQKLHAERERVRSALRALLDHTECPCDSDPHSVACATRHAEEVLGG